MMKRENLLARVARRAFLLSLVLFACSIAARAQTLTPRVCVEPNYQTGMVTLAADAPVGSTSVPITPSSPQGQYSVIINPGGANEERIPLVTTGNSALQFFNADLSSRHPLTKAHSAGEPVQWISELQARFGYNNSGTSDIKIQSGGGGNFTSPGPLFVPGQPSTFLPGIHENAFSVLFTSTGRFTWTLKSIEATATGSSTPRCGTITYQGRLSEAGNPANGQYDLQFTAYDALTGGTVQSGAIVVEDVMVSGGVFTVQLDFGASFAGNDNARYLEIGVRPGTATGNDPFTTLQPRQSITDVPFAINAQTATNVTNLTLNNKLLRLRAATDDSQGIVYSSAIDGTEFRAFNGFRWTNGFNGATERMRLDGSGNLIVTGNLTVNGTINGSSANSGTYIQNTTTQQADSNFNISGNGAIGGNLTVNGTINGTVTNATNAINATNATNATNADKLGGVAASNYVQTNDARLSDARAPVAGSTNYLQNTTTQQTADFNISGSGTLGGNLTVGGAVNANSLSGNGAGLTGIFSFYSLNSSIGGAIPANPSGYAFIGQTHTLTLTTGQRLTGAGSIPLATSSDTDVVSVGLCYQIDSGAITNFAGSVATNTIVDTTYKIYAASASVVPGAGSVQFGLCVGNNSQPLASNNVNGWVMLTNN